MDVSHINYFKIYFGIVSTFSNYIFEKLKFSFKFEITIQLPVEEGKSP